MITVLSVTLEASAFLSAASVFKSSAEKLSSNINILGFLAIALAIESLCFCPPDTLVPQRISTILHADQILVMDEGKIVGKGTHEELLKNCEVYQQIAKSQMSAKELGIDGKEEA